MDYYLKSGYTRGHLQQLQQNNRLGSEMSGLRDNSVLFFCLIVIEKKIQKDCNQNYIFLKSGKPASILENAHFRRPVDKGYFCFKQPSV